MKIETETFLTNGMEILEDMYKLGDIGLMPLFNQMHYSLTEIDKEYKLRQNNKNEFENVFNFLENVLNIFMNDSCKSIKVITKYKASNMTLVLWDKILSIIPEMIGLINFMGYHKKVFIYLDEDKIIIDGDINLDNNIKDRQLQVYKIYRKLFSKNVISTYELEESNSFNMAKIIQRIDLSHDKHSWYNLNLKEDCGIDLFFTGLIKNYVCKDASSLTYKHICLEITDELALKHYKILPDEFKIDSSKEIIHFNFLFRPLTIILPKKGIIKKDEKITNDVLEHRKKQYIDLFSLLGS